MKKIYKIIGLALIMFVVQFSNEKLQASSVYFSLQFSSNATLISNGSVTALPSVGSGVAIPYGSTIRVNYNISNLSGQIDSKIEIRKKEGLNYKAYYPGVLIVNGSNVSEGQYNAFISGGSNLLLGNYNTSVSIDMVSLGSDTNMATTDLCISSSAITSGPTSHVTEHAFYGLFARQAEHTINFYGKNQELISSQIVKDLNEFSVPPMWSEGFDFIGFNMQANGAGDFLNTNIATRSMNVYAIFETKKYTIRYFDNDKLLSTEVVNHGGNAKGITPEDKENNKFSKWDKNLVNVRQNMDVYAIYENDPKLAFSIKIEEQKKKKDYSLLEKVKNHSIFYNSDKVSKIVKNESYEVRNIVGKSTNKIILIVSIIGAISCITIYCIKKKKDEPKYNS